MHTERKIVKEEIVDEFFCDFNKREKDYSVRWWFKKWFYYRLSWTFQKFSFWFQKTWQKLTNGYSHYEVWDFKSHHAKWCIPRLKHLRNNHMGFPIFLNTFEEAEKLGDVEPYSEGYEKANKDNENYYKKQNEKWEEILDKMIWSFEHLDDFIEPIYPENYDKRNKKITHDDGTVSYEVLDKRALDYTPSLKHNEKVQEGLDLFAKFYIYLWD